MGHLRSVVAAAAVAAWFASPACAAEKPRIAVIPFNHISVSKADADVVTGLFETGLVKTETYNVIEQNQIKEILSAQEQSMSDCTDEQCAMEFGKLLAAEQIVLGTLSSVGGTYILNAKIIDVTTGRNIKAAGKPLLTWHPWQRARSSWHSSSRGSRIWPAPRRPWPGSSGSSSWRRIRRVPTSTSTESGRPSAPP
jgi:TolB-like protein